jgi:hypothetical protein
MGSHLRIQEARTALTQRDYAKLRTLLIAELSSNPRNGEAWYLASFIAPNQHEKESCLSKARTYGYNLQEASRRSTYITPNITSPTSFRNQQQNTFENNPASGPSQPNKMRTSRIRKRAPESQATRSAPTVDDEFQPSRSIPVPRGGRTGYRNNAAKHVTWWDKIRNHPAISIPATILVAISILVTIGAGIGSFRDEVLKWGIIPAFSKEQEGETLIIRPYPD